LEVFHAHRGEIREICRDDFPVRRLFSALSGASAHTQRKTKKPPLAPLPNGPTGPVPQIPLDSIASVPPQVTYQNGLLTIVAANSTLADILRAVKKQTGAEIEVPSANDRVVTHLGPGSAREVLADLLNGSRFNYVLLGSAQDTNLLTRVVLVAKTGNEALARSTRKYSNSSPDRCKPATCRHNRRRKSRPRRLKAPMWPKTIPTIIRTNRRPMQNSSRRNKQINRRISRA